MCMLSDGDTQVRCCSGPDRTVGVKFDLHMLSIDLIRQQAKLLRLKLLRKARAIFRMTTSRLDGLDPAIAVNVGTTTFV